MKRDSWLTFVVCSLTGAFVFLETSGYPVVKGQGFGRGPGFYPQVLAGTIVGLGLLTALLDFLHAKAAIQTQEEQSGTARRLTYRPVVALMLLAVFSILAMKYVGFLLSGFALTFLSVLVIRAPLKGRHVVTGFLYSLGLMALVYVVFSVLVGVQLPESSFLR